MSRYPRSMAAALAGLSMLALAGPSRAADDHIVIQSTTSTEASGLFEHILPRFEEEAGIDARVVAVGTGQALKNAQNCDGDVLFVHAKPDELEFVANGYGVDRQDVMYNDFVIVGPSSDPAGIGGSKDAAAALAKIAESETPFASRGDDSGTHKKELSLWQTAGIDPTGASGDWYRETGSGMGATLNTASSMGAYALTDRGTWISFENKGDLEVLVEGDEVLFNQYGVILVNPEHCQSVNAEGGQAFIDWITGDEGQQAIADYKLNDQQLFYPNADSGQS
jgi:tungstate transport system substrate-binding protein